MESSNAPKAWIHQQKILQEIASLVPEGGSERRALVKRLSLPRLTPEIFTSRVLRLHPEDLETAWRYVEAEQWDKAIEFVMRNRKRNQPGSEESFF